MTTYKDTQSLYEGQKQQLKESKLLGSIKSNGLLDKGKVIASLKVKEFCKDTNLTLKEFAQKLGITEGECLDVINGVKPFTENMQLNMYINFDKKLSTVRLDQESKYLRECRVLKHREIWDKFKHVIQPIRQGGLFDFGDEYNTLLSIKRCSHPLLGMCLKFWRAAFGYTQYSLADRVAIKHFGLGNFCIREYWEQVEVQNRISKDFNVALYKTFGITMQQIMSVVLEYLKDNGLNPQRDRIRIKQLLDSDIDKYDKAVVSV